MRIGIDLGGTKIELIALGGDGRILARKRVSTPNTDVGIYDAIAKLVLDTERELGATARVGIGSPGAASPATGLLRNSNTVCLNGKPMQAEIEKRLNREIRLANDANCFALSEAADGAAAGARSVFGVILGTGVGGGVVWRGEAIDGPNAIGGEWGHNPLPWPRDDERPGHRCYCGKDGCIETFLSGTGIRKHFAAITGRDMLSADIVKAAEAGDAACEAMLQRYEDQLARALSHIINVFDPDVVVLGGGMSNLDRLYVNVPPLLAKYVFSDVVNTRLVKNKHGDSSGVRGAAWLWPEA